MNNQKYNKLYKGLSICDTPYTRSCDACIKTPDSDVTTCIKFVRFQKVIKLWRILCTKEKSAVKLDE